MSSSRKIQLNRSRNEKVTFLAHTLKKSVRWDLFFQLLHPFIHIGVELLNCAVAPKGGHLTRIGLMVGKGSSL